MEAARRSATIRTMRVVLQRVKQASVRVAGESVASIGQGVLLLTGITHDDSPAVVEKMARKIAALRIFARASFRRLAPRSHPRSSTISLHSCARKG